MLKILLDTDIGKFSDDILAMLFALKHPEIEIKGITTVGPNNEEGADSAKEMVTAANKKIPVYNQDNAPDFLAREINDHKEEYNLVAIGPLTNIAKALEKDPNLLERVNTTYIMGGGVYRSYSRSEFYDPEYNFAKDPKSAQLVINAEGKKILVPLDASMNALIKKEELKRLKDLGELEKISYDLSSWYEFAPEMHDAITLIAMTNPEIFDIKKIPVSIREDGVVLSEGKEINTCLDFEYDKFKEIFDSVIYRR